jgi:signal transduction histidine kinase
MLLKRLFRVPNTLVFRLTLWYSGIFAVFFSIAFIFFQLLITSFIHERIDRELLTESEEFSSLLEFVKEMDAVKTAMILDIESESSGKAFVRLMDSSGEKFASPNISALDIKFDHTILERLNVRGTDRLFETLSIPQSQHKVRILYRTLGSSRILQIGQSMEEAEEFLQTSLKVFGITMLFLIPCAALVGRFMARRALMGVEEVTRTAIHISEGEYERRVPFKGGGEELDRLAKTFNNMLERIQELIREMREMTDNIAHDLRSPITRIRGIAETSMTTADGNPEYELISGSILEECDRLLDMINMMLDISEAEAGISKLNRTVFDFSKLVKEACELFQPIADDKEVRIITNLEDNMNIYAEKEKMQRVVANLLDNAVKYSTSGSTVMLSADKKESGLILSVKDNGIGISPDDLPHIFKRFYRCDASRSKAGTGLGLSWAQAIIQAHGGNISVTSSSNKGSEFTVVIP